MALSKPKRSESMKAEFFELQQLVGRGSYGTVFRAKYVAGDAGSDTAANRASSDKCGWDGPSESQQTDSNMYGRCMSSAPAVQLGDSDDDRPSILRPGELVAVKIIPVDEYEVDHDRNSEARTTSIGKPSADGGGADIGSKDIGSQGRASIDSELKREIATLRVCATAPCVLRYLASFVHDRCIWIVTEYCEGGSLLDVMRVSKSALTEEQIAAAMSGALRALSHLHDVCSVLHRDIKAANLLLTRAGELRLADFGVSVQLSNSLSRRSTAIGTPHWMAPEVIEEGGYGAAADVWSLGVTAIELAERYPPHWQVKPAVRALFRIPTAPAPRLGQPHKWSSAFHDFIDAALHKLPERRASATQLLNSDFVTPVCQECDRQAVLRPLAAVVPASSHSRAKHRMEQSGSQAEDAAQGSNAGVGAEAAASIAAVSADQGGCAGDHPAPGVGGGGGGESTRTMRDAWRIDSGTAAVETSALDEPSETASSLAPTLLLPATMELLGTEHLQRTVELSRTIELQHAVAPAVADSRASARASESAEARLRLRDSCQRDDGGATSLDGVTSRVDARAPLRASAPTLAPTLAPSRAPSAVACSGDADVARLVDAKLTTLSDEDGVLLVHVALGLKAAADADEASSLPLRLLCEQVEYGGLRALVNVFMCALFSSSASASLESTRQVVARALLLAVETCDEAERAALRDEALQETLLGLVFTADETAVLISLQVLYRIATWPGIAQECMRGTGALCYLGALIGSSLSQAHVPLLRCALQLVEVLLADNTNQDALLVQQLLPAMEAVAFVFHDGDGLECQTALRIQRRLAEAQ